MEDKGVGSTPCKLVSCIWFADFLKKKVALRTEHLLPESAAVN